jgi:hypothetical protein
LRSFLAGFTVARKLNNSRKREKEAAMGQQGNAEKAQRYFVPSRMVPVLVLLLGSITAAAQNVVTDWTAIVATTAIKNANMGGASSIPFFAYTTIAMYDAVNAIDHRFQAFYFSGPAPAGASDEVAAVAAAHRVLVNYFPAQQSALDAAYASSVDAIQASVVAKTAGNAVGEAAAAALIAARMGDGVRASVPYTPGSGPGVWQPTPPAYLPPLAPWLAKMRPFTMDSASQFRPDGPTPLDSEAWEQNYNLTRTLGESDSTIRTPAQTEIGLFWALENPNLQYSRAFSNLAINYKLELADTARLLAMLWTGSADSAIGCFDGKYHYNFWRPVTATRAGGGNPELTADTDWNALGATPNHPEYPAAHGCITSTVSHLVAAYFGTSKVRVVVDNLLFPDGVHTHVFNDTRDWFNEVFWARIYAGFHYHHSLVDGGRLGKKVAEQLQRRYFRPVDD